MTTHPQSEQILKEMRKGFRQIGEKFEKVDKKLDQLDSKLSSVDEKLSSVIVEVTSHGSKLDKLVTKKEFSEFKDQALTHFDGLSKQIEDIQEERTLLNA